MSTTLAPCPPVVIDALREHFDANVIRGIETQRDQTAVTIDAAANVDVLTFLKQLVVCPFEMLTDLSALDLSTMPCHDADKTPRFVVVYVLTSITRNVRLIVRAPVDDPAVQGRVAPPHIASVLPVYKAAVWTEREAFEMFGIRFVGHPDLRRLLTPEYFDDGTPQYPLRKDYPLRGTGDRGAFPVYDPNEELDLTRYGYAE